MKLRISGPVAMCAGIIGLVLAAVALRAWELTDGIHGILMPVLGKVFSLLPKPDDAEIPSFRSDSIFTLTEARLIFVLRFLAVSLSVFALFSALGARRRGVFSSYYASAILISFGVCLMVHKAVAIVFAVMALISVTVIDTMNKRRYNSQLHTDANRRP